MNILHKDQQRQFDRAYRIAAKLIVDDGEKYLPVFKRMHDEKIKLEARQNLANLALQAVAMVAE